MLLRPRVNNIHLLKNYAETASWKLHIAVSGRSFASDDGKAMSPRMQEFKKKLKQTSPIKELEEQPFEHPYAEKEPLPPWPNNTNPHTGEVNGPKGPEPTRYGDWERKGRVSDF